MLDITSEFVRRIAGLARLVVTPEEEARYAGQMQSFLAHVEKMNALDLSAVPETNQVTGLQTVTREDVPEPFGNEAALIAGSRHPIVEGEPTIMRVV